MGTHDDIGSATRGKAGNDRGCLAGFGAVSVEDLSYGADRGCGIGNGFGNGGVELGCGNGIKNRKQACSDVAEIAAAGGRLRE